MREINAFLTPLRNTVSIFTTFIESVCVECQYSVAQKALINWTFKNKTKTTENKTKQAIKRLLWIYFAEKVIGKYPGITAFCYIIYIPNENSWQAMSSLYDSPLILPCTNISWHYLIVIRCFTSTTVQHGMGLLIFDFFPCAYASIDLCVYHINMRCCQNDNQGMTVIWLNAPRQINDELFKPQKRAGNIRIRDWNVVITVPADGLAPLGARPSASTMVTVEFIYDFFVMFL